MRPARAVTIPEVHRVVLVELVIAFDGVLVLPVSNNPDGIQAGKHQRRGGRWSSPRQQEGIGEDIYSIGLELFPTKCVGYSKLTRSQKSHANIYEPVRALN